MSRQLLNLPGNPTVAPVPLNPWVIKGGIFVIGLMFVATPLLSMYSTPNPNSPANANRVVIDKESERIFEVLSADERFNNIKLHSFDTPTPTLCLQGKVLGDEELFQLKETIGFIKPKVKLIWMVVVGKPKTL